MRIDPKQLIARLRDVRLDRDSVKQLAARMRQKKDGPKLSERLMARLLQSRLGPTVLKLRARFGAHVFVIVVGDEGSLMARLGPDGVEDGWFAPVDAEDGPDSFREHLAADPKARVILMVDSLEQAFREEQLPKANIFDRAQVLKRRLDMAFPNDELRAPLLLKRKKDREDKGPRYLFAATPSSPVVQKWRALVESLPNPVMGVCLLPLESTDLIRQLVPREHAGVAEKHWRTMVSLEITGGFRLIIEQNDELVVTRLPLKPADEDGPAEVAELIEREFHSTIGYVKRMGYLEKDHMDVVIVTTPEVREQLRSREIRATSVSILTPEEAGMRLGVANVGRPGMPYADLLHAAWVAKKRKPRLQLRSAAIALRQQMAVAVQASIAAAGLVSLGTILYAADVGLTLSEARDTRDAAQFKANSAQRDLDRVMAELSVFPTSPLDMRTVLQASKSVGEAQFDFVPPLLSLSQSLGDTRMTAFQLDGAPPSREATPAAGGGRAARQAAQAAANQPKGFELRFTADFVDAKDADAAVAAANELQARLRETHPKQRVEIARMPVNVLPQQILAGGFSAAKPAGEQAKTDYTADYVVGRAAP